MRIGNLAEATGTPVETIRFYEREGLILSARNTGNQRRYARDTLRRLAFIRASQRVGIPLADIREALDGLPDRRTPTPDDWLRLPWDFSVDVTRKRAIALLDLGEGEPAIRVRLVRDQLDDDL